MPHPRDGLSYQQMREKIDLIRDQMQETSELLALFRDHDFRTSGPSPARSIRDTVICKVGIFTMPFTGSCTTDEFDWPQWLPAAERLHGDVQTALAELRRQVDLNWPPQGA